MLWLHGQKQITLLNKSQSTKMCMMRIVDCIPFLEAIVDEELENLAKGFVVLWLLKERRVSCVMKDNKGTNQSKR